MVNLIITPYNVGSVLRGIASVVQRDNISTGGYHQCCRGYHQYCKGIASVLQRDSISTAKITSVSQRDSISTEEAVQYPAVLNSLRSTESTLCRGIIL